MKKPFFTIIVVSYNAGDKLVKTVKSITSQTFTDYRILVKDGMSTDGSVEKLKAAFDVVNAHEVDITKKDRKSKITLLESCDNGIYHAMNIATAFLGGKIMEARAEEEGPETGEVKLLKAGESPSYIFFLNCGDYFRNENVLRDVHRMIQDRNSLEGTTLPVIYYGDIFDSTTGNRVASNPRIDDLACYRNVPSHQACFYDERLIYRNPFDLKYKVRADYEQFLRCFYREKAETVYMPVLIADYEGGGFSDKNKKISEQERREIILMYLPAEKVRKYDLLRAVTLAPLRTAIANNKITAGAYNGLKSAIYAIIKK
ncbi:glycosyltransferase [Butyrivibrio sp. FCS014]|uniref:glycosyltransferase n=1 Tax=Butyrivibrio sp. FCS014 TaxID=1408304 RepID=UPI00046785A1|nr:glycosyltransferase [Butyrivibrio sp. FCS014]